MGRLLRSNGDHLLRRRRIPTTPVLIILLDHAVTTIIITEDLLLITTTIIILILIVFPAVTTTVDSLRRVVDLLTSGRVIVTGVMVMTTKFMALRLRSRNRKTMVQSRQVRRIRMRTSLARLQTCVFPKKNPILRQSWKQICLSHRMLVVLPILPRAQWSI